MKYTLLTHQGAAPAPYAPDERECLSEDEKNAVSGAYKAINETPGVPTGLQLQSPETRRLLEQPLAKLGG